MDSGQARPIRERTSKEYRNILAGGMVTAWLQVARQTGLWDVNIIIMQ